MISHKSMCKCIQKYTVKFFKMIVSAPQQQIICCYFIYMNFTDDSKVQLEKEM